jgi:hypothetical protein
VLKWTGEETNFTETVNHFCRNFLIPKFKFLEDGRRKILPVKKKSLYLLCMCHLLIPKGAGERDNWERVIVPSIMRKYLNMKCNLNNDYIHEYDDMFMIFCFHCSCELN